MSVSLIDRGRLWGLIACHHYAGPHRPSYTDRTAAEFLGRTASLLLHTTVAAGEQGDVVGTAQRLAELAGAVGRNPRALAAALTDGDATSSTCCPPPARRSGSTASCTLLGTTPPADRVVPLVRALLDGGTPVTDAASRVRARGRRPRRHRQRRPRRRGGRRPRGLPRLVPPRDAARGHLGRQPVRVQDGADRRRPAAEPPPVVRQLERDRAARPRGRGASTRSPPRGRWPRASPRPRSAASTEDNRLAITLQRTLLLEELPKVPGVALAARYLPSSDDVVGGDWYDIVPLPGGRVSIVLGTSPGTGWPPPRSPPSCGTPCARTCCGPPGRPRRSTG